MGGGVRITEEPTIDLYGTVYLLRLLPLHRGLKARSHEERLAAERQWQFPLVSVRWYGCVRRLRVEPQPIKGEMENCLLS